MPGLPSALGVGVDRPPRERGSEHGDSRDQIGLGVLTYQISPEMVDEVIELAGCREKRRRGVAGPGSGVLRARTVPVQRRGQHGAAGLPIGVALAYQRPTPSCTLWCSRAAQRSPRPGNVWAPNPLSCCSTCGEERWPRWGRRVRSRSGCVWSPGTERVWTRGDTPANATEFGVTQGGNPQLRLLALIECGTHALIDAAFDGVTRASEQQLARRLLHALRPGMLLLADRNFPGYELWAMAAATGADLLWRIKSNNVFVVVKVLPDGSFLSVMPTPAENVRHAPGPGRR